MITREESLEMVKEHVKNENLVNHMIAVGAIMRGLAKKFEDDEELWGAVGILHDVDYETFGEDFSKHGAKSAEMVKDLLPIEGVNAILSHNELTGNKAVFINPEKPEFGFITYELVDPTTLHFEYLKPDETKKFGIEFQKV